jgi:serine/threonine protein kinase
MAITCPNCQSENASDAVFCNKCGSKLELAEGVFYPQTKTLQTPVKDLVAGTIIAEKYKLIEELGRGGMGVVYLAEQIAPVKRKVAVKIIKLGMDTKQVMARFEAERQALAMMDHSNIAKVFDAGTTETGRPYFVMEYVKGIPITEYIAKLRSRYGECLLNLGKLEKAEGELLAALPILMDTIGEQNKRTQQTILFLVELYEALDRIDEAEMYRQQLVQREH